MIRRPRDRDRSSVAVIDGVPTVIVRRATRPDERFAVSDVLLIRRIRALELAEDRWQFSFRPTGRVELVGKDGARLAAQIQRERPGVPVQVHYPDDD